MDEIFDGKAVDDEVTDGEVVEEVDGEVVEEVDGEVVEEVDDKQLIQDMAGVT